MNWDNRLEAVYQAVRPGAVAADVGTDHGYLICALLSREKCSRGFASDVNPGPLEAARLHIEEQGLTHRIRTVLSDGLLGLPGEKIDDVVLAGMGGELIAHILTAVPWTRNADKRFVLQPMTKAHRLRRELYRSGFALLSETAVVASRFAYTVMTAAYTGQVAEIDDRMAYTGLLWEQEDAAARRYLEQVLRRLTIQAEGQNRSIPGSGEQAAALAAVLTERLT